MNKVSPSCCARFNIAPGLSLALSRAHSYVIEFQDVKTHLHTNFKKQLRPFLIRDLRKFASIFKQLFNKLSTPLYPLTLWNPTTLDLSEQKRDLDSASPFPVKSPFKTKTLPKSSLVLLKKIETPFVSVCLSFQAKKKEA